MFISQDGQAYKARFTGHETFHLRYGWLKKAYDAISLSNTGSDDVAAKVFRDPSAIAYFGVGKNMVASIRHWALACGIVEQSNSNEYRSEHIATPLGDFIFHNKNGVDPYLERLSTLWLLHWQLCTRSTKTTFLYAFNYFNESDIEREKFLRSLKQIIETNEWGDVADATLQKDLSNLIGTYAIRKIDKRVSVEDVISSPLTELSLLSQTSASRFRFNRGRRAGLADSVFAYCLMDFWARTSPETTTLSFEAVCHNPMSPGRAFLMSSDDLMGHVSRLEQATNGDIRWVESSGSRHIARTNIDVKPNLKWLAPDYVVPDENDRAA